MMGLFELIRRYYPSNKTLKRAGIALCFAAALGMVISGIMGEGAVPATAIVNEKGPVVAITFDDGPYAKVTGHILDVLEANDVCATFFVLGSRIRGREELLLRMERLGCEVGNHSYSHADLTTLSLRDCQREIDYTNAEIKRVLGHEARVVRPPYGHYNKTVKKVVSVPMALWTVDTNDWKGKAPEAIADYVIEQAKEGSVILMHDQRSSTADAMEIIIPALIDEGFRFVTISELIDMTGGDCKGIKMPD